MLTWLILFIVFMYFEIITINLVTIWFAIGSVAGLITTFFTDSALIQTGVFLITSILTLILTRPFVKNIQPKKTATNADIVIGKVGIVVKEISKDFSGSVKIDGQLWTAITNENTILKEGTKVKVLSLEGVKINVMEVKD